MVPLGESPTPEATESAPATTGRLLDRYRAGKASALELLFQREIPLLRRWARGRLPGWARALVDTADLVQEALAGTLPHLRRFESRREKALQAYLRTAVANRIRNEVRRVRRAPQFDELIEDEVTVEAADPAPDAVLLDQEDHDRFARALNRLSAADQTAVVSRLQLGYSYEQIALLLERRSVNAARMAVTRAIAKLIEAMSEDDERGP